MIKMGFIIAQFDSQRQTDVKQSRLISAWFVIFILSGTWHGLHKPVLVLMWQSFTEPVETFLSHLKYVSLDLNISRKSYVC